MQKNRKNVCDLRVSQNFLTSAYTINKIVDISKINRGDSVIEIGPGKGHITRALAEKCAGITGIELDEKLCSALKQKFAANQNVKIIHADFLTWKLPACDYKIFANIPFSVTTDIVKKIFLCQNSPSDIWLIMQKGAAKRFLGLPSDNIWSSVIKSGYSGKIKFYFRREDFHPMPSVDTVLVNFSKKINPDISAFNQKIAFEKFLRRCIEKGEIKKLFSKNQLKKAFAAANITGDMRTAEIKYVQWLCLFRSYCYFKNIN